MDAAIGVEIDTLANGVNVHTPTLHIHTDAQA
jgi:hypothetical protein